MANRSQLSSSYDDQTNLIIGEGFLYLRSSAGNSMVFNDPAALNLYRLGTPGAFATTPDNTGSFSEAGALPTAD